MAESVTPAPGLCSLCGQKEACTPPIHKHKMAKKKRRVIYLRTFHRKANVLVVVFTERYETNTTRAFRQSKASSVFFFFSSTVEFPQEIHLDLREGLAHPVCQEADNSVVTSIDCRIKDIYSYVLPVVLRSFLLSNPFPSCPLVVLALPSKGQLVAAHPPPLF